MKRTKRSIWSRVGLCFLALVSLFFLLTVGEVLLYKYVPVRRTPLMVIRQVEARRAGTSLTVRKQWVTLDNISPELVRAVMASEDNLFLVHNGFSEQGLRNAVQEKINTGVVRHGGSTISQQTAKNVFCTPRRTYLRKAFEAYFTVLIELLWDKRRIMEVYLNVIEMGDGIFGAEAASLYYFHHSAARLNRAESALLAVCLPNPHRLSVAHPSAYVQRRQAQIMALMPKLGKIDLKP